MREAVIVGFGRSAVGKAPRGALKDTRPDDFAAEVVRGVLARVPALDPALIDDFVLGCAFPESEQGYNTARNVALRAGLPDTVAAYTLNRFCSSGLQAVVNASNSIACGQAGVSLAGGMESMSMVPIGGNNKSPNPYLMDHRPDVYTAMGLTAENVAERYGISRQAQDAFALASHQKAAKAQADGKFDGQIIPVDAIRPALDEKGRPSAEHHMFVRDEGVRSNLSMDNLAALRTVFKKDGTVTAGNASQTSDGAAVVVLAEREKAEALGLRPLARLLGYATSGVDPAYMGIGPITAIPKALQQAGLSLGDIDLIELNEAFASQALACIAELGIDPEITNVNGGAIALGHPLGCTGTLLVAKLLDEMVLRENRYGLVSMCIGGGMGAAAVLELM